MLEELAGVFWLALGAYVFWYVVKAKDFQPMTLDDLALTWRLHKHEAGCKSRFIHDLLVREGEIVGFRCGCGHEFVQKRLITQRTRVATQYHTLASLQNTTDTVKNLGLTYLNIKYV